MSAFEPSDFEGDSCFTSSVMEMFACVNDANVQAHFFCFVHYKSSVIRGQEPLDDRERTVRAAFADEYE